MATRKKRKSNKGKSALDAVVKAKATAGGPLWKALHVAESRIASAMGKVSFKKRKKRTRKAAKS